ncbi:DNA binding protein URE-B1 [Pseudohyphozyma bogoriensis]|nr:DNA binding protein URE-B1 [Pseudohyphozyma bogoriensis]
MAASLTATRGFETVIVSSRVASATSATTSLPSNFFSLATSELSQDEWTLAIVLMVLGILVLLGVLVLLLRLARPLVSKDVPLTHLPPPTPRVSMIPIPQSSRLSVASPATTHLEKEKATTIPIIERSSFSSTTPDQSPNAKRWSAWSMFSKKSPVLGVGAGGRPLSFEERATALPDRQDSLSGLGFRRKSYRLWADN